MADTSDRPPEEMPEHAFRTSKAYADFRQVKSQVIARRRQERWERIRDHRHAVLGVFVVCGLFLAALVALFL